MRLIRSLTIISTDKLAFAWATIVAYLSLSPIETVPDLKVSDKLEHFAAYTLLGLLCTLSRKSFLSFGSTLLLVLVYGGLIELIQPYVNRFMEFGDFAANTLGAVCGGAVAYALRAHWKINLRKLR